MQEFLFDRDELEEWLTDQRRFNDKYTELRNEEVEEINRTIRHKYMENALNESLIFVFIVFMFTFISWFGVY